MYKKQNIYQAKSLKEHKAIANQLGTNKSIQKKRDEDEKNLQPKINNTGLPNQLKTGVEQLSGYSMDDVKVHYNSSRPAQLQALAYAQGSNIHIAPGQEKHLPHEAWHIVQQKQGRVKPTLQMKERVNINDDAGLEKEADVMGAKANNFYRYKQKQVSPIAYKETNTSVFPIQRSIGCHLHNNAPQFQIDGVRPPWTGAAANIVLQNGQARCHIIAFEVIQNDLANILNNMLATVNTPNYNIHSNHLINLCNSLFITPGLEKNNMVQHRNALINFITNNGNNMNANLVNATILAGTLLSDLNSCADNLRAGDQGINASIGYSIDAEFLGGIHYYHGPIYCTHLPNAIQNLPQNTQILGPGGQAQVPGGTIMAGPFACIKLSQTHEQIVYEYQKHSILNLSFVINGIGGAINQNAQNGQHLSSTQMPVNFNNPPYPVLVQDPNGILPPYVYN